MHFIRKRFLSVVLALFLSGTTFALPVAVSSPALNPDSIQIILNKAKHDTERVKLYNTFAASYRLRGHLDSCILLNSLGLELAKKCDYKKGMTKCLNGIGAAYYTKGEYEQALKVYLQTLALQEQLNDDAGKSRTLNNIGLIYYETDKFETARQNFTSSLEISQRLKDSIQIARTFLNLAVVRYKESNYLEALHDYNRALSVFEKKKSYYEVVTTLGNIASVYEEVGKYSDARTYALHGLEYTKKYHVESLQPALLLTLAESTEKLGDVQSGKGYAEQALKLAKDTKQLEFIKNASGLLYEITKKQGNFKESLGYLESYTTAKDSLFSSDKERAIANIQHAYELAAKEKEIALLAKDKQIAEVHDKRSSSYMILFAVGFVFLGALALHIYRNNRQKQKNNSILEAQKQQLTEAYNDVLTLSKIGQQITSNLSLMHIVEAAYQQISGVIDATVFALGIYNDKQKTIDFPQVKINGKDVEVKSFSITRTELLTVQSLLMKEAFYIGNYSNPLNAAAGTLHSLSWGLNIESVIVLPLIMQDQILGVLTVQSPRINAYSENQFNMMKNVGVFLSIALANAEKAEEIGKVNHTLEVMNKSLEDRILERTAELESARVRAEESDKLKTALLSNMSHEFRTPLNGILGSAGILGELLTDDTQQHLNTGIQKSGTRLLQTLEDILTIAELEANGANFRKQCMNLSDELRELHEQVYSKIDAPEISYNFSVSGDYFINAEKFLIRKLFTKIIDNAFKYTRRGNISVTISEDQIDQKSYVRVVISDTGIGIRANSLKTAFEPFRQISEGMGRSYEGVGLGLSIAKKVTEIFEGFITVHSVPGVGSEFTVDFPLVPEGYEETIQHPHVDDPSLIEILKSFDFVPSLLLVEDNDTNISFVEILLRDYFHVSNARNGIEACEKIQEQQYHLLLVDINLGAGMNGIETVQKIREFSNYKKIPIAAMTGYTLEREREFILNNGFDYFLAKPFQKEKLLRLLTRMLRDLGTT
ncbi:MAG: tetratricopeptide repeat protein [Ignavibacteria bacterium]|nr:tetratricopeptide repeat protein [Ignavibacteria bacterium]